MSSYVVPAGPGESVYIEKRSSFLGAVRCVQTEDEARAFIADIKKQHWDARHNCWCYIIKDGPERYSDDGEPQGTAGIPMLEVFRKAGIVNVVCVVTRYFGGVLLGAGGLFRAYTKAAKDALENAGTTEICPRQTLSVSCPYPLAERIKLETFSFGGEIENTAYGENVVYSVSVLSGQENSYISRIVDFSSGTVLPKIENS